MTENTLATKSLYDDFSRPTNVRKFEIITEEQSMFLNAGWLAELSPWFANYCFGDAPHNDYHVDDFSHLDMLEFCRCIFFCPRRKPLVESNVALILKMAVRFDMLPIVEECEKFISEQTDIFFNEKSVHLKSSPSKGASNIVTTGFKTANDQDITVSQKSLSKGRSLILETEGDAENIAVTPARPIPQPRTPAMSNPFPNTQFTPVVSALNGVNLNSPTVNFSLTHSAPRIGLTRKRLSTPYRKPEFLTPPPKKTSPGDEENPPVSASTSTGDCSSLSDLENRKGETLEVVGCVDDNPAHNSRDSGLCCTSFTLRDSSKSTVKCEVWRRSKTSELTNLNTGTIVSVQGKVSVVKGAPSLICAVKHSFKVNPNISEAERLRS